MNIARWLAALLPLAIASCTRQSEALPAIDARPSAGSNDPSPIVVSSEKAPVPKPAVKEKPDLLPVIAQAKKERAERQKEPASQREDDPRADKGAKLLLELLRPGDGAGLRFQTGPKKLPGLASLEKPVLALPPYEGLPTRFPLKPLARKVGPMDAPEPTPLSSYRRDPEGPQAIRFSVQALERWSAVDSGEPAPLPLMAQPQADRVSLAGVSGEASRDAALAGEIPTRTTPIPFARFNLPDPFENRLTIRVAAGDAEDSNPVVSSPRPIR